MYLQSEADETMLKSLVAAWERSKKPGGNAGAGQAAADVQVMYHFSITSKLT